MAWPGKMDKDEISKELFGESAEQVKARLAKLDTIEGSLKATGETIDKQNKLIEDLSNNIKAMKVSSPYESTPKPENTNTAPTFKADWGEDADAAFQERFASATSPLIGTVLDTRASISKRNVMEVLDKQYHDWALFADEIDELAKTAGLQQKVQEDFWKNCYWVCKGKHHDEIVRDQNQKSGKFWSEPAGSSVVVRGDENRDPKDLLTDEDKKVAAGLGVPLEIYAKNKQSMGGFR